MASYNPQERPETQRWLQLDEDDRAEAVFAYHRQLEPGEHPEPGSWQRHAVVHALLETQIARGEPSVTARVCQKLISEGLDRHTALHALGREVARAMWESNTLDPREPDEEAVAERLRDLEPAGVAAEFREA